MCFLSEKAGAKVVLFFDMAKLFAFPERAQKKLLTYRILILTIVQHITLFAKTIFNTPPPGT